MLQNKEIKREMWKKRKTEETPQKKRRWKRKRGLMENKEETTGETLKESTRKSKPGSTELL